MKKLTLALVATAAFAGQMGTQALAADLAARPVKAPPPIVAPVYNWTGFWISGGFGYGLSDIDHSTFAVPPGTTVFDTGHDNAGRGWLGKVGVGGDYQFGGGGGGFFGGTWVIGAFADAQWTDIKGNYSYNCPGGCAGPTGFAGQQRLDWSWAVGGRLGYVALPGLLTYVNGGYTEARFNGATLFDASGVTTTAVTFPSRTYTGWFVGGGTEYAISQLPGLFWKNEYRYADYSSRDDVSTCISVGCGGIGTLHALDRAHPIVQTITTEFVYRFNWGSPVVAKY